MRFKIFGLYLFLLLAPAAGLPQALVINELLSSNNKTNFDEDGDSSDWIEIINQDSVAVNLGGLSLTDRAAAPLRWTFPEVQLGPGEFLLVWASGKSRRTGELHANFKLSSGGEFVGLFDSLGIALDSLTYGRQLEDVALARIPDGSGSFMATDEPTPGRPNRLGIPDPLALTFTPPGGFFDSGGEVLITSAVDGATIRYTTDGAPVQPSSQEYLHPISFSSTRVIRARAFNGSAPVSDDISHLYLVDYAGHLPVLSLAADPDDFFGRRGIFSQPTRRGRDWERPVAVNLLELDGGGFRLSAGARVHGAASRTYPKKSMRLYFRSEYGESKLHYRIFKQKSLEAFDQLVVHAGGTFDQSFDNDKWTLLRDPLNHALMAERGHNVSPHRPVLVYINGEFWGMYMLRERISDDYLEHNHGIDDADLLEWAHNPIPQVKAGDRDVWSTTWKFFKSAKLRKGEEYEKALRLINVESFMADAIVRIFVGHTDWPHNNNIFFRDRMNDGKWNWILWDVESTYKDPTINTMEWATRDTTRPDIFRDKESRVFGTTLLRQLVKNDEFEALFVSRFADFMNSSLQPDHIREVFDHLVAEIEPDVGLEAERWDSQVSEWMAGLRQVRQYIERRPEIQRRHLREFFDLPGEGELTLQVEPSGAGSVRVNSLRLDFFPWRGIYFSGVPVEVEALAAPGFEFSRWDGIESTDALAQFDVGNGSSASAVFSETPRALPEIVAIVPDSGMISDTVAIRGRLLSGANVVLFASGSSEFQVRSDSLLVAAVPGDAVSGPVLVVVDADTAVSPLDFLVVPPPLPAIFSFAPDSGRVGTPVKILGEHLDRVTVVRFGQAAADSLLDQVATELMARLPVDAESGLISLVAGGDTVFSTNSFTVLQDTTVTVVESNRLPGEVAFHSGYPNPSNAEVTFEYDLVEMAHVQMTVFNVLGQVVQILVDEVQPAGARRFVWTGIDSHGGVLGTGVYFVRLVVGERFFVQKILLQR